MVVTDRNNSTVTIAHAHPATTFNNAPANDVFSGEDPSEEFIYVGNDAIDDDAEDVWPTGGTASDPEAEGGRDRYAGGRKKKVRWEIDEGQMTDSRRESSGMPPVPRRRRSRSLSGDELFNFRAPSKRSSGSSVSKGTDHHREPRPAPVVLPHLPMLEGGWQEKPFSLESGIPIIIQRPITDDSQPIDGPLDLSTHVDLNVAVLTASPNSFRTLSASDDDQEGSKSTSPLAPMSGPALSSSTLEPPAEDTPTAPNSPSFPPLPTPAPSTSAIPKFTAPNFVQSPKPAILRTVSRDRSIDLTSRAGVHWESNKPLSDNMYKSQSSSRFSRQSSSSLSQRSSFNRRQFQVGPSSTSHNTTKQSPPNMTTLTASPRSPIGHSLSPRTPQSTILSPAPLPSISIMEDPDFITPRSESPPWQTVGSLGSSVNLTSPRTSWRTEVINNSSSINLIKSPPVTPFTSVHLRIDELPNETDSDHESVHPSVAPVPSELTAPIPPPTLIAPITPDSSISQVSPRPAILSPSPPRRLGISPPPTPPLNPDDLPLSSDVVDEALVQAYMPWPTRLKESAGILPVRKIVKRAERGEWEEGVAVNDIPRQSALWRLVRAQRLWLEGHQELFKLKHPSGLPRDHRLPKTQYVDDGEPLKAIETLVQSILLDPRVVAFKSPEARKDFMEQLAWQIYADSRYTDWPELGNLDANLDDVFAKAVQRTHSRGIINTRRALSSFIRNHVVIAILEEQDGFTQAAILKYGRALDTIDWVNASLSQGPDKNLYGKGESKQRVEAVFNGVFGRGVQIRLGHTIIAQYTYIKRDARYSLLRNDLLAELLQGSINLFESISTLVMSPYTHPELKLDVYVSDYVYHIAHAFFFQGFYARENGKIILDMGRSSPRGGRSAVEVAKERSASSAQAFIQAGLLFPEDEEERIECFEMALEEILKVGGIRVGEALAMYQDLQKARITTDALWNRMAVDNDEEGEEPTAGLFDDDATLASKKKKKKKKKKKDASDIPAPDPQVAASEPKAAATPGATSTPVPLPSTAPSAPPVASTSTPGPADQGARIKEQQPWTSPLHSFRTALIDSWLGALRRSQEEKRIMGGDVLHPAKNLRGRPEVVWKDVFDDGDVEGEDEDIGSVPWASWGMRSVKATKWEDLVKEEGVPKGKKPSKGKSGAKSGAKAAVTTAEKPQPRPTAANKSPTKSPTAVNKSPTRSPLKATATTLTPGPVRRSLESSIEEILSEGATRDLITQNGGIIPAEWENGVIPAEWGDIDLSPGKADRQPKPAGIVWDRPTPWSMVQRISKQKLFAIDMDAFDGEGAKS